MAAAGIRLDPSSGSLILPTGRCVQLGRRATAILAVLMEHAGRSVTTHELLERAWPGQTVDPTNVAVQISSLRTAIEGVGGLDVLTDHGRGYRLAWSDPQAKAGFYTNLPHAMSPLLGREAELAQVLSDLTEKRLSMITGLVGIGKTSVALAAARLISHRFRDGAWLIRLEGSQPVGAAQLTAMMAAQAGIGSISNSSEEGADSLAEQLRTRSTLFILDGCERLAPGAIRAVERIVASCPEVSLLLTSHIVHPEFLRHRFSLGPLATPGPTASTFVDSSAGQLFLQAFRAAGQDLKPEPADVRMVAEICRRLGGVPLAIEIAAWSASLLGLETTSAGCLNPFRALSGGFRTGQPGHRSLQAALQWASDLLLPEERAFLLRLSALPAVFTVEEVQSAPCAENRNPEEAMDLLQVLQDKSFIQPSGGGSCSFELNPFVRAYLVESSSKA